MLSDRSTIRTHFRPRVIAQSLGTFYELFVQWVFNQPLSLEQSQTSLFQRLIKCIKVVQLAMPLVDYSDSEHSEPEDTRRSKVKELGIPESSSLKTNLKRKRSENIISDLPPLPDAFRDLYASNSRLSTQDDPTLHGGRQRATPHVDGQWPTHVYIECMFSNLNRLGDT